MQAANRVVKNTGILYLRMAITVFISLYSTRLVLLALGATDFGVYNVIGGAIAMLTFLNTAMTSASQRFMSYSEGVGDIGRKKKIFNISLVLHLIIGVLVVLILEIAGYFLFDGILNIAEERIFSAKVVFQFMIVSMFFTIISVPYDAIINSHENMLLYALISILEAILKLGIAFYITYSDRWDKLITYGILTAFTTIVLLIIRRVYCHKKYSECSINVKKYYDRTIFKEMASFAGWSFLGSTSSIVANYGQSLVLNVFFGTIVNAAQGVVAQVNGQLSAFSGTMLKALNPLIAKSEGSGERDFMVKVSIMGTKVSFFLLIIFFIPVILEAPFIFKLWLKEVPEYTVLFFRLLSVRTIIEQLFITLTTSIAAVGQIRKFQLYASIINILPLIIAFYLFQMGYPAHFIYISFIGCATIKLGITLYFSNKVFGLSLSRYLSDVVGRCSISLILIISAAAMPLFFIEEGFLRLFLVCLLCLFIFFIVVCKFGLTNEEFSEAKAYICSLYIKWKQKTSYKK